MTQDCVGLHSNTVLMKNFRAAAGLEGWMMLTPENYVNFLLQNFNIQDTKLVFSSALLDNSWCLL